MQIYISAIKDFLTLNGIDLVTPARKEKILAYRFPEDRARSLAAGLLMRHILGITDDTRLTFGKYGKPNLDGKYFNISHSGGYTVLAVADSEVGVDIERIRDSYSQKTAERCFTPKELEWLNERGDIESFFRLWAAKESIMKALGLGLKLRPRSFCTLPFDSSPHIIHDRTWYLFTQIYDAHVLCAATENTPCNPELITLSPFELGVKENSRPLNPTPKG